VVVLLRGFAASAGHLAVARAGLKRERGGMKEHAWKAKRAKYTRLQQRTAKLTHSRTWAGRVLLNVMP
jgi:hypothetical protein